MTITQTVEIPANRQITLEVPHEIPEGKAQVEFRVIPFVKKEEIPVDNDKIRFTRKELDEMVKGCPITQRLSGILSDVGDVDLLNSL